MTTTLTTLENRVERAIRNVPDFPKPGIMFKDITPVLEDPRLCHDVVEELADRCRSMKVEAIAGVESRGFLFGMPLAIRLGVPFITVRKKGKLPYHTVSYSYDLEYGSAEIEMHQGSVTKGMRVMIHDDLLATGGTAAATAELILQEGGHVAGFTFLVELAFLEGTKRLEPYTSEIENIVSYA
ncbi:MAG: adenine phosphoribosyltransferase [Flavobacteriales bacterium]|nr:adenine phosphoribosyltransferase [Flavobacteriales bacterium]